MGICGIFSLSNRYFWEKQMLRGLTTVKLDSKGRLAMPVRYRQSLTAMCDEQMVLTVDTESPCLLLYPINHWQELEQKLTELPSLHSASRRVQRLLIGHATDIQLDANGRFLLPSVLREYASLNKDAVLVGQMNKFELWSETLWQKHRKQWLKEILPIENQLPEEVRQLKL